MIEYPPLPFEQTGEPQQLTVKYQNSDVTVHKKEKVFDLPTVSVPIMRHEEKDAG